MGIGLRHQTLQLMKSSSFLNVTLLLILQSHTSCFSGVLCPPQNHKQRILLSSQISSTYAPHITMAFWTVKCVGLHSWTDHFGPWQRLLCLQRVVVEQRNTGQNNHQRRYVLNRCCLTLSPLALSLCLDISVPLSESLGYSRRSDNMRFRSFPLSQQESNEGHAE